MATAAKILGVAPASLAKVAGVAKASIKKVMGVELVSKTLQTLSLTSGMLSTTGTFASISLAGAVDGTLTSWGFYTHNSGGQTVVFDLGSAKQVETIEFYVNAPNLGTSHVWTAGYSDNGSSWTATSATLTVNTAGGSSWRVATTGNQGDHRYWRMVKDSATSQMDWVHELKVTAYV
jgi:hypothetical protein